jgi:hypothetical protein
VLERVFSSLLKIHPPEARTTNLHHPNHTSRDLPEAEASLTMATNSVAGPAAPLRAKVYEVPWHKLKDWIAEQEAFERKHRKAAELTSSQIKAIAELIPNPESFYEPIVSEKDWVSSLHSKCRLLMIFSSKPRSTPFSPMAKEKEKRGWHC